MWRSKRQKEGKKGRVGIGRMIMSKIGFGETKKRSEKGRRV